MAMAQRIALANPGALALVKKSFQHTLEAQGQRQAYEYHFLLHQLRHDGLGDRRQATRLLNFVAMVEALRARAPHALYDERLLKQRRKSSLSSTAGTAQGRVVTSSNASENDLAAHLLAIGHLKGQL